MIKPRFLPTAEAELLKEVAYYSIARDGLGNFDCAPSVAKQIASACARSNI